MRKIEEILKLVCSFLSENNMEYLKSTCKKIGVYDALLDLVKRYEKYGGR
jgi:hypothetical protein